MLIYCGISGKPPAALGLSHLLSGMKLFPACSRAGDSTQGSKKSDSECGIEPDCLGLDLAAALISYVILAGCLTSLCLIFHIRKMGIITVHRQEKGKQY